MIFNLVENNDDEEKEKFIKLDKTSSIYTTEKELDSLYCEIEEIYQDNTKPDDKLCLQKMVITFDSGKKIFLKIKR